MAYRLLHTAKRVEKQLLCGLQHGRFNSIQVGDKMHLKKVIREMFRIVKFVFLN